MMLIVHSLYLLSARHIETFLKGELIPISHLTMFSFLLEQSIFMILFPFPTFISFSLLNFSYHFLSLFVTTLVNVYASILGQGPEVNYIYSPFLLNRSVFCFLFQFLNYSTNLIFFFKRKDS